MSDQLQRDIVLVQATIAWGAESPAAFEAWQRLKPRLTPDRERLARAICSEIHGTSALAGSYLLVADAAIAAME